MSGHNKARPEELAKRIDECVIFILKRNPNYKTFINWHQPKFDKKKNTATTDWQKAWAQIHVEGKLDTDANRARRVFQLEQEYEAAEAGKDRAGILMQISKLEGIDVNKHELNATVNVEKPIFNLGDNVETDDGNQEDK